jgi:hypothetical protein
MVHHVLNAFVIIFEALCLNIFFMCILVGVLDSGVSRSTRSWATSTAQLRPLGAGRRLKPNEEDPREEEPHKVNDDEALETRRPPHEGLLVRRKIRSTIAQHNPTLMKG